MSTGETWQKGVKKKIHFLERGMTTLFKLLEREDLSEMEKDLVELEASAAMGYLKAMQVRLAYNKELSRKSNPMFEEEVEPLNAKAAYINMKAINRTRK